MLSILSPQDLLGLIDLCPFLASDRLRYNDYEVLSLLRQNPRAACLRAPFHRFGIGADLHPLALVVALGGSLEVVKIMVEACPEALGERLSGKRNLLHYAISEGVDVEVGIDSMLYISTRFTMLILTQTVYICMDKQVITYLVSQFSRYLKETDSYNAIPLHLTACYPSSSLDVMKLLLKLHPNGAKSIDNQSRTPLHRACKSRSSLQKVMALVEAAPEVLTWRDWCGYTPLEIADRLDHRLGDVNPEVVGFLELVQEIMQIHFEPNNESDSTNISNGVTTANEKKHRAGEILMRFRFIGWTEGIPMVFTRNTHLFSLIDIPTILFHEFVSLLYGTKSEFTDRNEDSDINTSGINWANRLNTVYIMMKRQPLICETST